MERKVKNTKISTKNIIRKRNSDLTKSSDGFLKNVMDNLQDIVIVYNIQKKKILLINKSITSLLNYKIKDIKNLKNEDIHQLMHSDDYKKYKKNKLKDYEQNISLSEFRLKINNSKNYRWFKEKTSIIKEDKLGNPEIVLYTLNEITYFKELEKKLKEYTDELKELNRSKDKYFSILAHDLRGPFTALLGFSNLLKEDFDYLSREEIKHYISLINSSSKNIYGLIENLLQWSRLQTGRLEYQPANTNLNLLVEEVVLLYKSQANSKYIDIIEDIPTNTYVYADENMLRSVLQNLVSNSIKFSDEGGKVIISAEENNNKYKITVSDTGIGIHPEVIDKLFKIDFHYTTPGTRDERGSGLGLILCKEFIEKHGSHIEVKSEQKIGTTISFDLKKGKVLKIKK
ncbi:MAG: HAMP domain-containing histidine kinase [Ignavibacteria bacterium]|nr:HAMP domain-containing histidine kinase [Ignavibacteria bacterium]